MPLRNKLHGQPDVADAGRVRDYARKHGRVEPEFEMLAQALDELFAPRDLAEPLRAFAGHLGSHPFAETEADLAGLRGSGCDISQGYFIARPMAAAAFADWIAGSGAQSFRI